MEKIKNILSILLILSMLFAFVSCGDPDSGDDVGGNGGDVNDNTGNDDTQNDGAVENFTYTVKVLTEYGLPIKEAMVYVHKSDESFHVIGKPALTDENGVATFTIPSNDNYSVQVISASDRYLVPEGDAAYGRYALSTEELVIRLSYNPEYTPTVYTLGDKLADITLTDVNGNTHQLSELLKTKDMVMLNFWFVGCPPCRAEFPAINSAYNAHKDNIEILAINNTDSIGSVQKFPSNYNLTIDFPLIAGNNTLHPGKFASQYCPTTVIVDRYGVICLIEIGGIPSESVWSNVFAYFTSDGYTQSLFTSVDDILSLN